MVLSDRKKKRKKQSNEYTDLNSNTPSRKNQDDINQKKEEAHMVLVAVLCQVLYLQSPFGPHINAPKVLKVFSDEGFETQR